MRFAIPWLILIGAIVLSHFCPSWIEQRYSNEIYPRLVDLLHWLLDWIPISLFWPFLIILLYGIIKKMVAAKSISIGLFGFNQFCILVVGFFYIMWGFNYSRVALSTKLNLSNTPTTSGQLELLMDNTVEKLNRFDSLRTIKSYSINLDSISIVVKKTMGDMGYLKLPNTTTLKRFWPKGLLLRFSTAGFYFPFTAECNTDPGLHELQFPFVSAHEIAHGYGEAEEGACNYIAYIACQKEPDSYEAYSSNLAIFKTLQHLVHKSKSLVALQNLKEGVKMDFISIKKQMDLFPDILPEFRDFIFSSFLKLQGIQEGQDNYEKYIEMIIKTNNSLNVK